MFVVLAALALASLAPQSTARKPVNKPANPCKAITSAMLRETLELTETCYAVNLFATVSAPITINPGVTVIFGPNSTLSLEPGGSLEAVGTAEKPIHLRGKDHSPGYWNGLNIGSNSSKNHLAYVTIEDAGDSGATNQAAVLITPNGRLAMEHTTVRNAKGNGLLVMQRGVLASFEANHFEGTNIPINIKASDAASIDPATTFENNKNNVVFIHFGDTTLTEDALWRSLAVPYRFDGHVNIEAHLTIEAGARLEFKENLALYIEGNGSLTAVGTPGKRIVFTSTDPTPGFWSGINFGSASRKNVLRNVDISFGGSRNGSPGGCVGISPRGSATVQSSTLSSCPVAIFLNRGAQLNPDAATSNTFQEDGQNILTK